MIGSIPGAHTAQRCFKFVVSDIEALLNEEQCYKVVSGGRCIGILAHSSAAENRDLVVRGHDSSLQYVWIPDKRLFIKKIFWFNSMSDAIELLSTIFGDD